MKEKFYFIEDILPDNIKKLFDVAKHEKEIIDYAKTLLNDSIRNHCKPIYINNKIIVFAVDNPIWANEIMNYKHHILASLNKKFNNYLKDLSSKFLPKYFIEKKQNKSLNEEDKDFIEQQTKDISDQALKEKLSQLIETFIIVDKK